MMLFLRLDCIIEQGSDKNLGQATDWEISDLISLMEVILEECSDDLEGVKSKSRFIRFSDFKPALELQK